jgi:hypothetical protein
MTVAQQLFILTYNYEMIWFMLPLPILLNFKLLYHCIVVVWMYCIIESKDIIPLWNIFQKTSRSWVMNHQMCEVAPGHAIKGPLETQAVNGKPQSNRKGKVKTNIAIPSHDRTFSVILPLNLIGPNLWSGNDTVKISNVEPKSHSMHLPLQKAGVMNGQFMSRPI